MNTPLISRVLPALLVTLLISAVLIAGCTSEQPTAKPVTTLRQTSPVPVVSPSGAVDATGTGIVRITETTSNADNGKDTGLVRITKTVSSARTSVGEDVIVKVTLENDMKDTITDVKFDDPAHPPGLTGSTVTGTLTELGPGLPFFATYTITAETQGKYTLRGVTATFTNADGSIGKVTSDTVSLSVV